jgi:hypothetical protein
VVNQNTFIFFDFFGDAPLPGAITFLIVRAMANGNIGVMQNIRLGVASLDCIGPVGDICQMFYVKLLSNSIQDLGVQIHFRDMANDAMTRRTPGQPFLQGYDTQQDEPYQISDNFVSHTKVTRFFGIK